MGKPCEWPKCQNLTVFGDKYNKTPYGEMCPYHALMIQMYDAKPNKEEYQAERIPPSEREESRK